jgi:integrase/recombinase XerC/integrase/recombinase XerD
LTDVSVSTYLTALRRFCAFLVDRRVLAMNPAKAVNGNARPSRHSRAFLSDVEVNRLLSVVPRGGERGARDFGMILLMLEAGLSEIELIRADVRDLHADDVPAHLVVQGKGRKRKDETVSLPRPVVHALHAYLATRGTPGQREPLFLSAGNRTRGLRMTTRGIRDRVNGYLQDAGIRGRGNRKVSPYSLRHTAAIVVARSGASPEELRRRMRLGSLATALLYIHQSQGG